MYKLRIELDRLETVDFFIFKLKFLSLIYTFKNVINVVTYMYDKYLLFQT